MRRLTRNRGGTNSNVEEDNEPPSFEDSIYDESVNMSEQEKENARLADVEREKQEIENARLADLERENAEWPYSRFIKDNYSEIRKPNCSDDGDGMITDPITRDRITYENTKNYSFCYNKDSLAPPFYSKSYVEENFGGKKRKSSKRKSSKRKSSKRKSKKAPRKTKRRRL